MKAKDFFASTLARKHRAYNVNTVPDSQRPADIFIEVSQWQCEKDHLRFGSVLCSGDKGKPATL